MATPLIPESPGFFSSILDSAALPGYAIRNILKGNLVGAGKNLLDFGGDILDAPLPGDWIGHLSEQEDKPEFSDVIGGMEDGFAKTATDFVGGVLTDPLTYVPGALVAKGLGKGTAAVGAGVRAVDKVIPGAEKALKHAKLKTKSTFGYLEPSSEDAKRALRSGSDAASMYGKSSLAGMKEALTGLDEESAKQLSQVIGNYTKEIPQGPAVASGIDNTMDPIYRELLPGSETPNVLPFEDPLGAGKVAGVAAERTTKPMIKLEDQLAQWNSRIDSLGVAPEQAAKLKEYAGRYLKYSHNNFMEKTKDLGALKIGIGDDVTTMIPQDYAHRMFSGPEDAESIALKGGNPNSLKGRTLKENENFRDFMNENRGKGIEVEEDLLKSTAHLAGQEGRIAQRTHIAKSLLGDEFKSLTDETTGPAVTARINALDAAGDPEGAYLLKSAWEGLPERGNLTKVLHKANTLFKPAAVFGLGVPRVGGIAKNIASFPFQLGMGGDLKQAGRQLARTPATAAEAARKLVQGYGGDFVPATAGGKNADVAEAALAAGGGRAKNVIEALEASGREDLADALRYGVDDGFVSAEAAENSIRNSSMAQRAMGKLGMGEKGKERVGNFLDAPGNAFRGAEGHARRENFLEIRQDLMKQGLSREEASMQAAERVNKGLYDYSVQTAENRALRDAIPFAAYQTNAIRQSAQFAAKNPWAVAVGSQAIRGDGQDPTYPYMDGQTTIPIGESETGDAQYLTGLGLPFEALNSIPNLSGNTQDIGSEFRDNIVGSSQPLIKTAYSLLTGEDPKFDTQYGSYTKLPGNIEGGDFGSAYNKLAGTGLIQPLTTPLGQLGQMIDDRTSIGDKALSLLTGTRVVNVDEDRAIQQRLQQALKSNPDIQQALMFYQNGDDPESTALLKAQREAKERLKKKREAKIEP